MGDQNANTTAAPLDQASLTADQKQTEQYGVLDHVDSTATDSTRHAFHGQIVNLAQPQDNNDTQSFDMRQMSSAMPSNPAHSPVNTRRPSDFYNSAAPNAMMGPGSFPYFSQMPQPGQQRQDQAQFPRAQPQQFIPQHYSAQATPYQMANRQPPAHIQTQPPYTRVDPYTYGMAQPVYSPVDMRYPQPTFPVAYGASVGYAEMSRCS